MSAVISRRPPRRPRPAVLFLALSAACGAEPVTWDNQLVRLDAPPDAGLIATAAGPQAHPREAVGTPEGGCPASARAVRHRSGRVVVWWHTGPNGTAELRAAAADSTGVPGPVTVVDQRDTGSRGCDRPPPAIAAGPAGDYLHVAYWLEAKDGAGVYFAHSMDGGRTFHAPVAVLYGTRPAWVDVASRGDTVVVIHEDPNAATPRTRLAVSRTAGHIFEHRVAVPGEAGPQRRPVVALAGARVYAGWRATGDSVLIVRPGTLALPDTGS